MGRQEQRQRDLKKAAKRCMTLDSFLPSSKRRRTEDHTDRGTRASEPPNFQQDGLDGEDMAQDHVEDHENPSISPPMSPSNNSQPSSDPVPSGSGESVNVLQTASASDIGCFVKPTMSPRDIEKAIQQLSTGEKYTLLKHHKKPSHSYVFPTRYVGGCNRSFKMNWLEEHPWMVYSEALDGAFCIACALFCTSRTNKGQFVNQPFRMWQKKSKKCKDHERAQYHQEALCLADDFAQKVKNPETSVVALIDKRRAANIEQNRSILKCIAEAVLFCGKQCIALRGDSESINTPGNPGNFLSLLKLIANYDEALRKHLHSPAMKCVTHMSPQTQNELLEVMAKHILLRDIVKEIKKAKYYSIMADEVTSHNTEQLAFCVRFVDTESNIREEFLTFMEVKRITGEYLADAIVQLLEDLDIPVENIRGQGFDGASNMSSNRVGVQARIREHSPLATYIHCSGHCLNLVISHSCTLPEVRNVLDKLKHCCRFFQLSPKRNGLLEFIVKNKATNVHVTKRKAIIDLCKTRWAQRHSAYQHFYQAYTFIVEALELIGYGQHIEEYEGDLYSDWDTANRTEAREILSSITRFDFIVVFLIMYQYLSHLSGVTIQLQSTTLDIIDAHAMVDSIKDVYKQERRKVQVGFQAIYDQSVRLAEKVGTIPSMPRITGRQQHRSNATAESVFEYFKKNAAIPFLDHIISDLDEQFSCLAITASSLLGLVPTVICTKHIDISDALEMYRQDLPSPELVAQEITRWKLRYKKMPADKRPATSSAAIKDCDPVHFPNIRTLLQLACTLPVTSCECERSASTMRRLNTYMRASMCQERLTSLALLHIHYDQKFDLNEVVDIYARLHPRRMELDSLIKP